MKRCTKSARRWLRVVLQMYENEENGEVKEEDVGSILEIMLGVENIELACVFLCLDNPDAEHMTYGKMHLCFWLAMF